MRWPKRIKSPISLLFLLSLSLSLYLTLHLFFLFLSFQNSKNNKKLLLINAEWLL